MKPKRRTDTREAVRRLLHVQRGLIAEIGQLRKYVLEIYQELPKQHWTDGKYRSMRTGDTIQHGEKIFLVREISSRPQT